jgi:hypothetical protein
VYCLGIRYDAPGMFFLGHILRECYTRLPAFLQPSSYSQALHFTRMSHCQRSALITSITRRWLLQACLYDEYVLRPALSLLPFSRA